MQHSRFLKTALVFSALAFTTGQAGADSHSAAKNQILYPNEDQQSFAGPSDLFTGNVRVDPVFPANDVAHYSGAYVIFEAGARTAWHEHPAGQHIVVTKGTALTGTRDGEVIKFHEGESVWCPPELDHWHGATPDEAMTHFVVTASKDGENVIWKEKVSDSVYQSATE